MQIYKTKQKSEPPRKFLHVPGTHAAGQYALFKYMYLHSFSLIYMFI